MERCGDPAQKQQTSLAQPARRSARTRRRIRLPERRRSPHCCTGTANRRCRTACTPPSPRRIRQVRRSDGCAHRRPGRSGAPGSPLPRDRGAEPYRLTSIAARARIVDFAGTRVLSIERFDRGRTANTNPMAARASSTSPGCSRAATRPRRIGRFSSRRRSSSGCWARPTATRRISASASRRADFG